MEAHQGVTGAEELAETAKNTRREQERAEFNARRQLSNEVRKHPELSDEEKTGWLLAIEGENSSRYEMQSGAEAITEKLTRVEAMVSRPDTPIVYDSFIPNFGRKTQVFYTNGEGLSLFVDDDSPLGRVGAKIGTQEQDDDRPRPTYPNLHTHLSAKVVAGAALEADDVEELKLKTESERHRSFRKEDLELLVMGTEAVQAYLEQLIDEEHPQYQTLVEGLLLQGPVDGQELLAENERLEEWFETMRADRLELFAKHMHAYISGNRGKLLRGLPETAGQMMELYGIEPEEIRQKALEIHGGIREELESIDPQETLERVQEVEVRRKTY